MNRVITIIITSTVLFSFSVSAACNIINGKKYGDCSNVNITTNASNEEALIVTKYEYVSNIINGAIVKNNAELILTGISNKKIFVEKGGVLEVSGVVNGGVENRGYIKISGQINGNVNNYGEAFIEGIIHGQFYNQPLGSVTTIPGAIISGIPQ